MLSYAQRIARNYYQNMAPLPDSLDITPEHLGDYSVERLRGGLIALYEWMAAVYRRAADVPDSFGLPAHPDLLPRDGNKYAASSRAVKTIPALVYGLGSFGVAQEQDSGIWLQVDRGGLSDYCRQAKIKKVEMLLGALGETGQEVAPGAEASPTLTCLFPDTPDIALALPVFARACGAFTKNPDPLPIEFCRADLRVLHPVKGRKRALPFTVNDALRPLEGEQAAILTKLDRLVESLGYRAEVKNSGLARGEWRASYRNPRLGRKLFGFVVEENTLKEVRINFHQTSRILPYMEQCPPAIRQAFCAWSNCSACGRCTEGPLRVMLDGETRKFCRAGSLTLRDPVQEQEPVLTMLLETQAHILAEG